MDRRKALTLATLGVSAVGCSVLSKPSPEVSPALNATIVAAFNTAQAALIVLQFVPGIPAIVVSEANVTLQSLQEAYEKYKASPPGNTAGQAAIQAAIDAASAFIEHHGLPAAMASPPARRRSVRIVRP